MEKTTALATEHASRPLVQDFIFSFLFQIYILFVQDGDGQSKRASTSYAGLFFVSSNRRGVSQAPPTHPNVLTTEEETADPRRQHLSCSCLTFIVSSAKKDKQRETAVKNGGGDMTKWLKQERKNTSERPARPPSRHALIHPLRRGNVT